ncbi:unnamed protein product, partial [Ectocarpus sp. 4 AP-2014]
AEAFIPTPRYRCVRSALCTAELDSVPNAATRPPPLLLLRPAVRLLLRIRAGCWTTKLRLGFMRHATKSNAHGRDAPLYLAMASPERADQEDFISLSGAKPLPLLHAPCLDFVNEMLCA